MTYKLEAIKKKLQKLYLKVDGTGWINQDLMQKQHWLVDHQGLVKVQLAELFVNILVIKS